MAHFNLIYFYGYTKDEMNIASKIILQVVDHFIYGINHCNNEMLFSSFHETIGIKRHLGAKSVLLMFDLKELRFNLDTIIA